MWDSPEADDGLGVSALWEFTRGSFGLSEAHRSVRKSRKTAASDSWRLIADPAFQHKQDLGPATTDPTSHSVEDISKRTGDPYSMFDFSGFELLR